MLCGGIGLAAPLHTLRRHARLLRRCISLTRARVRDGPDRGSLMQVTVELPDEIARRLAERQPDLSRAVLEATAIEAVRDGVISAGKAAEMLGVSRDTMEGILKRAEVYLDYTLEDLEQDRETHRRLGI